jgi:hypothetical protein
MWGQAELHSVKLAPLCCLVEPNQQVTAHRICCLGKTISQKSASNTDIKSTRWLLSVVYLTTLLQYRHYTVSDEGWTIKWEGFGRKLLWFTRMRFLLDTGFIDHLHTQLGTISNCSAIVNLHTLQITTAHAKSFRACCVFTSRSLITASNSGDSLSSALNSSLNGSTLPTDSFLHRLTELTWLPQLSSL